MARLYANGRSLKPGNGSEPWVQSAAVQCTQWHFYLGGRSWLERKRARDTSSMAKVKQTERRTRREVTRESVCWSWGERAHDIISWCGAESRRLWRSVETGTRSCRRRAISALAPKRWATEVSEPNELSSQVPPV